MKKNSLLYYLSIGMRTFTLLILMIFLLSPINAQTKSTKKGIAYGHHSIEDISVESASLSWWYNWSNAPESEVANVFQNYNMEFVPMAWNSTFDETAIRNYYASHTNCKYLLGFNEPNFTTQANLTPKQVAALWPKLEKIASDYGLKLVSPAVNYCDKCVSDGGVTYSDPVAYLDAFFASCPTCKVDYIAVHNYMCYSGALSSYIDLFKKYNKPIWLTEFACWDQQNITLDMQKSYIMGALDYLENEPSIFRYSWFNGDRSGKYPYLDLFKQQSGELTELGTIYVNYNATHDPNNYVNIPSRIEAESYNSMYGISLEKCQDVDGMADVGWIDAGDWLEYNVNASEAGSYVVEFRIASNAQSSIQITENGVSLGNLNVAQSGGYQSWTTISTKITLSSKQHKLRINTTIGQFNLNWLKFYKSTGIENNINGNLNVIYPNPVSDNLHITNNESTRPSIVKVIDQIGKTRISKSFEGGSKILDIDVSSLESGPFIVQLKNDNNITSYVVIKQ